MIKKYLLLTCLLGINQPNAGLFNQQEQKQLESHLCNPTQHDIPKLSKFDAITKNHHAFNDAMQHNPHGYNLFTHSTGFEWQYYWIASIYNHIFNDETAKLYTKSVILDVLSDQEEPCTTLHDIIGYVSKNYTELNHCMLNIMNNVSDLHGLIDYIQNTISEHFPEANLDHLHNWDNMRLYGTDHDINLSQYENVREIAYTKLELLGKTLGISALFEQIKDDNFTSLTYWSTTTNMNILREQINKMGFAHTFIDTSSAYDKHENQFNYESNSMQADQYIFLSDLISSDQSSQDKIAKCAYEEIFNEQISPEFYAAIAEKIASHLTKHTMNTHDSLRKSIKHTMVSKYDPLLNLGCFKFCAQMIDIKFNIPDHRDDLKALYYGTIKRRAYIAQHFVISIDFIRDFIECTRHYDTNIYDDFIKLFIDFADTYLNQDIYNLSVDEIMEKCKAAEIAELFDPRNYVDMMMQGDFDMHLGLFLIKPNFI